MVAIGVTGHRILSDIEQIEFGLDDVAARLADAFPDGWTVVSALAAGADLLAARRLLARPGSRLVAVLPVARDDYETDFDTGASKAEFRDLLDQAAEVLEIPPQPTRHAAYEAAGSAVLDHSDVLVAVWDGQGAQGPGGTGGIVADARRRDLPVAWVHAGNRSPGTQEPTSLGAEQGKATFERFPRTHGSPGAA